MTIGKWYLLISGVAVWLVLALPVGLAPTRWARLLGWREPDARSPLALYFGRSLAAMGAALGTVCLLTAGATDQHRPLVLLLVLIGSGASVVHVAGVARGEFPRSEAYEVPVLLAWTLWGIWVYSKL